MSVAFKRPDSIPVTVVIALSRHRMALGSVAKFLVLAGWLIPSAPAMSNVTVFIEVEIRKLPSPSGAGPVPEHLNGLVPPAPPLPSDLIRKSLRPSPGTRFSHRSLFADLLAFAYGINRYRIVGPDWMYGTWYEIYFETREKVPDIRPVLRQFLSEQFGVDATLMRSTGATLFLEMPRGQPSLPPSKAVECRESSGGVDFETLTAGDGPAAMFNGCTMKDLARALEVRLHRRVIDGTSCETRYDFTLNLGDNLPETAYMHPSQVWGEEMVEVAAKSIRQTLGVELREQPSRTDTLVVKNAKRLRGTVHRKTP